MKLKTSFLYPYFLAFFLIFIATFSFAQSPLDLKVTATFQELTLVEIFDQVSKDQAFTFYYRAEDLPDQQKFSITLTEMPIREMLRELLKGLPLGYFDYRFYGIIIGPKAVVETFYTADFYKILDQQLSEQTNIPPISNSIQVGDINRLSPTGKATIKGKIVDAITGEVIIGATAFFTELNIGTASDAFGTFDLTLPSGRHDIKVAYIGYQDFIKTIAVVGDGDLVIKIQKEAINLQEVLVKAEAVDVNIESAQIGVERLDVQSIKKLPSFMGEADVIKSLLLQPGVSTIGEGAVGFNVRGGQVDQNLVMQDEGFLFNASHALGFFSTFNPELISYVTLYKGNIPAQYGGRLASVLDVEMRDGSFREMKVKGGIGPVSTKISFEGPLKKEKTSFITGFRSTYSDWILDLINIPEVKNSSAFFYDGNARLAHRFNDKNTLILSGYSAFDKFTFNKEFGFEYSTQMGQLIYKSIFSEKFFSKFTATYSRFESTQLDLDGSDASELDNDLAYVKIKEHLTLTPNRALELNVGLSSILYLVEPGNLTPYGNLSQVLPKTIEKEQGLESAAFLNASWEISPAWTVNGGLRLSAYQFLGPKTVANYTDANQPNLEDLEGFTTFEKGEVITNYFGFAPRISARYRLNKDASLKIGFSRTNQFINLITNTNTPTPSSQWQLSTEYIKPQRSNNFSIGYFKNYQNNNWETSVEIYGRQIADLFEYKDFAELNANENLETQLLPGIGRAYGLEVSIKKKKGILHGWISYTLSRTEKQVAGINRKEWFPSNFDKPHDLSLVLNYQPNNRNTFTLNFNYGSGRPTTAPLAIYKELNGFVVPVYSDRNQIRIPAYHRLDVAYTLGQSYKKDRKFRTSWTFSLYNLYGRSNAFSVFFTQKPFSRPVANQLAILGNIFPALSINFESI